MVGSFLLGKRGLFLPKNLLKLVKWPSLPADPFLALGGICYSIANDQNSLYFSRDIVLT